MFETVDKPILIATNESVERFVAAIDGLLNELKVGKRIQRDVASDGCCELVEEEFDVAQEDRSVV